MKKLVLLSLSFLFIGSSLTMGQELIVKTYGVSPRDVERDTVEMYFDRAYNGLMNVGNETKVFLMGQSDEALSNPSWTFIMKPAGSMASFGTTYDMDDNTQLISFIPDLIGTYKIEFTDGAGSATITINSAEYFGVEGGVISCVGCHNTSEWDYKYDEWSETGHATMLEEGLNGFQGG